MTRNWLTAVAMLDTAFDALEGAAVALHAAQMLAGWAGAPALAADAAVLYRAVALEHDAVHEMLRRHAATPPP